MTSAEESDCATKRARRYNFFIQPPRQRQKWGETQTLPHVNWGDLFFDLFYVGAAYNLGHVIMTGIYDDGSFESFLYYYGCFGCITVFWVEKLTYDARFSDDDDVAHKIWEVLQLCFLGMAVTSARPINMMRNLENNSEMFCFSLACFLGLFMEILRKIEIGYVWVDGDEGAIAFSRNSIRNRIPSFIFLGIATVFSGWKYKAGSTNAIDDYNTKTDDHRILAGGYAVPDSFPWSNDIPIYMCCASFCSWFATQYISMVCCFNKDFKKVSTPMNIGYVIHRYGEWTMLMLGESVLSLLIVETNSSNDYYITFFAGLISVILLQLLHFNSNPHHADGHAMRRDRNRGFLFAIVMFFYSFALVLVGVSYKMLLTEFSIDESDDATQSTAYRLLGEGDRFLAGGETPNICKAERMRKVSLLFGSSLLQAWTLLEIMVFCHNGLKGNLERCKNDETNGLRLKVIFIIVFIRIVVLGLMIFIMTGTLTGPEDIAMTGLLCVAMQLCARFITIKNFPQKDNAGHSHV